MRRAVGVCVIVAACGAGCSDKPPPIVEAKPLTVQPADKASEVPHDPPPEKSDPAAAAVVAAAVAAHTGGHPELLQKLLAVEAWRTGVWLREQQPRQAAMHIRAVWPDKYRADSEVEGGGRPVFARVGADGWMVAPDVTTGKKRPLTPDEVRELVADAPEWLVVLTPLGDPSVFAAPTADRDVAGKPAAGVRLGGKHFPNVVAYFDKESKLLARFAYEGVERGKGLTKEVTVTGYQTVRGVKLPAKVAIRWNGEPVMDWNELRAEFPVEIDPKVFDQP